MWTRAQLKEKAKYTFKLNYWKVVIVTFLMMIMIGGIGAASNTDTSDESSSSTELSDIMDMFPTLEDGDDFEDNFEDDFYLDDEFYLDDDIYFDDESIFGDNEIPGGTLSAEGIAIALVIFLIILLIIIVIAIAIGLAWSAFIANPVIVGANRFFFKSLNEKAEVREMLYAFDNNYKNVATVMFYKSLYEVLWTLLFIIPGIVKAYEYRMIPYLLAENPNLTKEQAFAISKQMMDGQKWDAFVLDLSFIGWEILSVCTIGILGIFYVNPYVQMTNAALYEELSLKHGRPALMEPIVPEYTYVNQEQSYTAPEEY